MSFSLRGMFIVVTIACIWLAIVATRARKQQQAVDRVQKLGGILHFDYQRDSRGNRKPNAQPQTPEWLRRAIGEDYFRRVVSVDFNFDGGNKATDADLALFRGLPDVTVIELNNNPRVTDAGLAHLAGLSKLHTLYLYRSSVKGPGIRHLPRSLQALMLTRTPLTDEGLVPMKNMTQLTGLRLGFTKITDKGLVNLSGLTALEDLELRNTNVSDAGLEHLMTLKQLKWLSLDHTKVTSAGIARLQQALPKCFISPDPRLFFAQPQDIELWPDGYKPSTAEILAKIGELGHADADVDVSRPGQPIVSFSLLESTISDESLIRLLAEMPELENLHLYRVVAGDRLAKELPRLTKLQFLNLSDSRITDEGLAHVGRVSSLVEVTLENTKISDAGLMHLTALKKLRHVGASNCDVSDDGYARFKQALPKCSVSR